MASIVVTGSGAGLGREICLALVKDGHNVLGLTYDPKPCSGRVVDTFWEAKCDVTNGHELQKWVKALPGVDDAFRNIDALVNCAGINRIGYLENFVQQDWDAVMDTNAKSIFLTSRAFLPLLSAWPGGNVEEVGTRKMYGGTILNIVSNASHMPMTGSLAYNASKGAAHIMTLQLARELTKRHGITVFGISPNKLAGTDMSRDIEQQVCATRGWTEEHARKYQLDALLSGEETDPKVLAQFIAYLLKTKENHKYLTGCVIPYGA